MSFKLILISFGITLLILWTMLLPGYVLTLDMVFTPHFYVFPTTDGFLNNYPIWHFLQFLYVFLPGWAVEKLMLFSLFFTLSYLSLRFLPVPNKLWVRLFASLLYTANTFVYVRVLAGQWTILFAYALLPLFIHLLFKSTHDEAGSQAIAYRTEIYLGITLALIGLFSLHFLLLSILVAFGWWGYYKAKLILSGEWRDYTRFALHGGTALITFLIFTSYWTIPALLHRHTSVLQQFTLAHWQAFAAAGHGTISVPLNLTMLGGFWAEAQPWATYFIWPQFNTLFLCAWVFVLILSAYGIYTLLKSNRGYAVFFVLVGFCSLVLATGTAHTPFAAFNLFLYTHLPLWDGLRDSQKMIGFLALSYAVLASYGVDAVLHRIERFDTQRATKYAPYILPLFFLIPLFFGIYVWGGFWKQLPNVEFPASWARAEEELRAHPNEKALILPWQGYFSLAFDRYLIVGNPAQQYFGPQAVVSQNIRLGGVYDQSPDDKYRALDEAIQNNKPQSGKTMAQYLKSQGINDIIYLQDLRGKDNFTYAFLNSNDFELEWPSPELLFYRIK